jgi:hypothetical protein
MKLADLQWGRILMFHFSNFWRTLIKHCMEQTPFHMYCSTICLEVTEHGFVKQ